jgi:hypothetical protein
MPWNSLGDSGVPLDLFDLAQQLLELFLGDLQVVKEHPPFVLPRTAVLVDQVDDEAQVAQLHDVQVLLSGSRHRNLVEVLRVLEYAFACFESRRCDDSVV